MEPNIAALNALKYVLEAKPGESILIISDDVKKEVGQAFAKGAIELGLWTRLVILNTELNLFRTEIPSNLLEMLNSSYKPDIYINTLRDTAKETPFRIKIIQLQTRKHLSRLGHCPGITMDMLSEGALSLSKEEHTEMQNNARNLLNILQDVDKVLVKAPAGSNFELSVQERTWFSDTFLNWKEMKWMNLPTGEVLVGPIENSMNGTLVCDLAIGGIGPIKKQVKLEVQDGRVEKIESDDKDVLKIVKETQATDEMAKYIGEFAFGLNPKARLVEQFLESEKVGNAVHVAFGNNIDYPGVVANNSANHQDFLINKPSVDIIYSNGRSRRVMEKGKLSLK
ncbi:MAG: aminopeptidase [Candidatus Heimdallarchaeota archaeon]